MTIYDHSVPTADGGEESLKKYEGKVLLVVNTATGCGFTPQYKELESMYEAYRDKGFEILDIPCNQFAGQTPAPTRRSARSAPSSITPASRR